LPTSSKEPDRLFLAKKRDVYVFRSIHLPEP
jgi:hypothetical protein